MTPSERGAQSAVTLRGELVRSGRSVRRTRRSQTMLEVEAERLSARVEELEREKAALEAFAAAAEHDRDEPHVMSEA